MYLLHKKETAFELTIVSCFMCMEYYTYTFDSTELFNNIGSAVSVCSLEKQIIVDFPVEL